MDSTTTGQTAARGGELRGTVVQTPFGLAISGRPTDDLKLDFGVRGGYVDSHQRNNNFDARFSGFTDTSITTTATLLSAPGFQPFVSMNANLPTGTTVLRGTQANATTDPDISQISGFGEGTNIGPTAGVNIPISQNLIASFGVGYTDRGTFTRTGANAGVPGPGLGATARINPGDVLTATASIGYQQGQLSLNAQVGFSWESTTTIDNSPFYKAGDRVQAAIGAGYAWTNELSSRVVGSYSHFDKNKALINPPVPAVYMLEPFNSNNDIYTVTFDTTYRIAALAIGPTVGFTYRAHNSYDPTSFQFVPGKTVWTAGGVAQYAVTNQAFLVLRVQHAWADVDASPSKTPFFDPNSATPALHSRTWIASFGGTIQF